MKNHIIFKFIAIALCAACLLGIGASGLCFLGLGSAGMLGSGGFQTVYDNHLRWNRTYLAENLVRWWAASAYGGFPEVLCSEQQQVEISQQFQTGTIRFTIEDASGNLMQSTWQEQAYDTKLEYTLSNVPYEYILSTDPDNYSLDEGYVSGYFCYSQNAWLTYRVEERTAPPVKLTLYLSGIDETVDPGWELLRCLYGWRQTAVKLLIGCGIGFAVLAVFLCCTAGRKPGTDAVSPGGLNRLPLDLYALWILIYGMAVLILGDAFARTLLEQSIRASLWCFVGAGYLGCLLAVGFCFAAAAQLKAPDYYWWKNTVFARCCSLVLRLLEWFLRLIPKGWALLMRLCRVILTVAAWLFSLAAQVFRKLRERTARLLRWAARRAERIFSLLPLTWQWLIAGMAMIFILLLALSGSSIGAVVGTGICIGLVLYGAGSYGTLLEAAQKMRSGNLENKIDSRYLVGSFRDFADELNGLNDVVMIAAQRELKSERMKTELITNVSHDIKTPLTSIINYVDLMAKPHTPEQEQEYLEVLSRQSHRMKKLIEDLIEMNKASTGSIPVEITPVDAVEAVNQALGEFSDKLDSAGLTPVFHAPQEPVIMLADGRLVWRAMSNLLGNAVKYALPGTRMYLDVSRVEDKVIISIKNISRAELNVSADELLERFVRGDTSRNTEGSGLGLNIAKSLMELQKGQLQLLVDGDLFKATLIFPSGEK